MFTASTALACVDTSLYIVQITQTDYTETYNGLQLSCEILFDSLVGYCMFFFRDVWLISVMVVPHG
jgi:hypothetical protein